MNRQEAIAILQDISWQMGSVKRWENIEAIDMAIEALQDDWIPVSERLPEDGRDVLVYLSSRRMTIACYNNHKSPFRNKAIGWGYKPLQGKIDFVNECVIAWQPLPEIYRPEGENK